MMRKTKVICTLGPSVDNEETLRKLILAGMNCARFNFSRTHESHLATLTKLKRVRDELGESSGLHAGHKGPESASRVFETGPSPLTRGAEFTLSTEDVLGDEHQVSVTYENLHKELGRAAGCWWTTAGGAGGPQDRGQEDPLRGGERRYAFQQ